MSAAEETGGGGASNRELSEQKAASKIVRVLTVFTYLLSVSLAAILLSVYYTCVWKPPALPPANASNAGGAKPSALRAPPMFFGGAGGDYDPGIEHPGRSNTTVGGEQNTPPSDIGSSLGNSSQTLPPNDVNDTNALDHTTLPDTTSQDLYDQTSDAYESVNTTEQT